MSYRSVTRWPGFMLSMLLVFVLVPWSAAAANDLPPPPDAAARAPAWIISVAQPGIQRVSGAALAAAGLNLAALDPALLHLHLRGVPVPLELRDGGDGRLDAADEVRFVADTPGDRWNAVDRYWLTVGTATGARMAVRSLAAGSPPFETTALERGVWYTPTIYDSTTPGADGDHFFVADLRAGPELPDISTGAWLTPTLPLLPGSVQVQLVGVADDLGPHQMQAQIGSTPQTSSWSGAGAFDRDLVVAAQGFSLTLTLLSGANQSSLLVDRVVWERPVALEFNGRGAAFSGWPDARAYRLNGVPTSASLYDITNPQAPQILPLGAGSTTSMAETFGGRSYLLAGPGTLYDPPVTARQPVDLATPLNVQAVYIAPGVFHSALAPLVAQRQAQGYSVAIVEPQAIYDTWSHGMVSPDAIRNFLRYARDSWAVAPLAAVLVGDGTYDPRNYLGRNNELFVPPYLAPVDPWLLETACETCYGQLDGASPLDDPMPDVQIGRLPVKSSLELERLVAKLLIYETAPAIQLWRARAALLADDSDYAGDFAAELEAASARLPHWMQLQRVYYAPHMPQTAATEPDATRAQVRTLAALNGSAGLVVFMGHSHPFQWAANLWRDSANGTNSYLAMLAFNDADLLTNRERLPIVLAMTCRSSAFHTPAFSGTTIDERLLLNPNGGAAAVWGSTGLGVAYGHSALMRGFFEELAATPPGTARLGNLTHAGYRFVLTQDAAHADAVRTFVLLGDPLMPARVQPAYGALLPVVMR